MTIFYDIPLNRRAKIELFCGKSLVYPKNCIFVSRMLIDY